MMRRLAILFFGLLLFVFPQSTSAHAFGQLYNLPVPFWMYLYGGTAVIIFSFVIIALFSSHTYSPSQFPTKNLPWLSVILINPIFLRIAKTLSFLLFGFTILTGLVGEDYASANFNMTFFWIWFVLGFSYAIAVFGDVWQLLNPWKVFIDLFYKKHSNGLYDYPKKFSYYPALVFYILFISIELFGSITPFSLSLLLLLYTCITLGGVTLWGEKIWFSYGEFFSVFFRLLGMMSFLSRTKDTVLLRIPFSTLLSQKPAEMSLVLFIIFMLSSTAFDGIHGTVSWILFISSLPPLFGNASYDSYQFTGLIVFLALFTAAYIACMLLLQKITKTTHSLTTLSGSFAYSLVPIAFVYNVAHYYTLLITEGQSMIRLISDPFGYTWDIFGTSGNFDVYIPSANVVWHSQVFLIIIGHIIGVYLSHMIGIRLFPTQKKVLLSQIPLLVLMIMYTMIGLWILSQPLTAGN